ncbi:hypothetical protein GCM10023238_37770 [Streptomyces heliomycini]
MVASIKKDLGLDQPLLQQYVNYMTGLVQGDFGTQIASQRPISDVITDAFPVTIRLTISPSPSSRSWHRPRRRRRSAPRHAAGPRLLTLTLVLVSMPSFVLGFLLQYLLAFKWSVTHPHGDRLDDFGQLALPATVLASLSLAYVARLTRTSIRGEPAFRLHAHRRRQGTAARRVIAST